MEFLHFGLVSIISDSVKKVHCFSIVDCCSNIICGRILESEKGIFDAILEGKLDLESAPWPSISAAAKDLIRKMLNHDPKKRITAAEALGK